MKKELCTLLNVANIMKQLNSNEQSDSYKHIIKTIDYRIFELCEHRIIDDYVDIDLDTSCNIKYCSECLLTFNSEFIFSYLQHSLESVDAIERKLYYNNNISTIQHYWNQNNKIYFSIILKKQHEILNFDLDKISHIQCDNGLVVIKY